MFPYEPAEWSELFVASAGAAAALAGLVFVAVSINLERILALPGLPERALQTVLMLLVVVVISLVGLIPGQDAVALGVELLGIALVYAAALRLTARRIEARGDEPRAHVVGRSLALLIGAVPLLVGGVSILAEAGGGLYWIAGGIIATIVGGVSNAWVLLVEIQR